MKDLIFFIVLLIGVFVVLKILKKYKVPKLNSLVMVTGGVKAGKSTLSVHMAISTHKRNLRHVKFKNFFRKIFNRDLLELPLLYSNVPLAYPHVLLDTDLLLRKKRFVYGSVIYMQEASLVADSMLIKDKDINNNLLLFNKLISHETHGGTLIYDTQCISDVHYGIKRSMSNYFYVHHTVKWIPFFVVAYVRELMYSDDGSVINNNSGDVEDNLKKILIPKSVWKKFDCYSYSTFTDNLPVERKVISADKNSNLKCQRVVSFRPDYNIQLKDIQEKEFYYKVKDNLQKNGGLKNVQKD